MSNRNYRAAGKSTIVGHGLEIRLLTESFVDTKHPKVTHPHLHQQGPPAAPIIDLGDSASAIIKKYNNKFAELRGDVFRASHARRPKDQNPTAFLKAKQAAVMTSLKELTACAREYKALATQQIKAKNEIEEVFGTGEQMEEVGKEFDEWLARTYLHNKYLFNRGEMERVLGIELSIGKGSASDAEGTSGGAGEDVSERRPLSKPGPVRHHNRRRAHEHFAPYTSPGVGLERLERVVMGSLVLLGHGISGVAQGLAGVGEGFKRLGSGQVQQ